MNENTQAATPNENTDPKIIELKLAQYDLIERQSVLAAENNRLEQIKAEIAKRLDETRKAFAAAQPAAVVDQK